jgi:hypothetical protein
LGTVVKRAKGAVARGHATTQTTAFLKNSDTVTGLNQGIGASDAGHASANNGEMLRCFWSCAHVVFL